MNAGRDALAYRRLRAPREPGGVLLEPPLDRWTASLAANVELRTRGRQPSIAGLPLDALRSAARELLVDAARTHTAAYRSWPFERLTTAAAASRPIVLTGHQPQLFHPGVWFKNFVLAEMTRRCDAVGVNLIIDNDTLRGAAIRTPTGTPRDLHVVSVPLDTATDEVPFEERSIRDVGLFASFPRRVREALGELVADPLVDALWPAALHALRRSDRLGLCLSEARHVFEGGLGLPTCDVPLSVVCDAWPFRWFAVHLLDQGERFRDVYNRSLAEYRRTHRIRSRSHPVPELARDDDWLEAPFWVWTSEAPRRRRLFARRRKDLLELTDRAGWRATLELPPEGDASRAVEQLAEQRAANLKLRPRALLTTLYARLVLGDHFVHGIGGAKYDQLTDALFERFFGMTPPAFVTATATLCLSVDHPRVTLDDVRELEQRLRSLDHHPERWLSDAQRSDAYVERLVAEKRRWLAADPPRGARLTRHRALGAINEALQPFVAATRSEWQRALDPLRDAAHRHALLASREYSYCLFSNRELPARLLALSARTS